MSRLSANCLLLLAAALWGMGFVAQSTAMDAIGPFIFTGLRFLAATLLFLPFALYERSKPKADPVAYGPMVLIGLALFIAIIVQQIGLLTTSVTNAGFLTALYVVMVPILALFICRERPSHTVWIGAILALCGLYFLTGANIAAMKTGDALMVVSALFWAIQVILVGRLMAGANRPFTLATTQFGVTALFGLIGGFIFETTGFDAIIQALPEILYAGLVSGGIAFTLQIIAQRHTTSSQAALFLSTESVFAALFGALFLSERLGLIAAFGAVLILVAILFVELSSMRATKSP